MASGLAAGVAYEQAGRDDEALAAHRQALALAPDNPAAETNLALFYANHGETAEAETLYCAPPPPVPTPPWPRARTWP